MSYLGNLINQDDKDLIPDIQRGATVYRYHEQKQGEDKTITDRERKRIIRSRRRER